MPATLLKWINIILLGLLASAPAHAGSRQHSETTYFSTDRVASFAKRVERYAGTKGARVFIVGRVGSPPESLPSNVQFTHVGIAVYSKIATGDGGFLKGYAIHNLYQQRERIDRSELVQDYPLDFFAGAADLKAGIIIPTPLMQQRLLKAIETEVPKQLHNPQYSLISNPYSPSYQNCTEHLLDILFSTIYNTTDKAQLKVNQRAYFKAQPLAIAPFKRMMAPLVSEDIKLKDHGDQIKIATFSVIADFMVAQGFARNYAIMTESETNLLPL